MPAEQTIEVKEERELRTSRRAVTELSVIGMTCGNCARHVTEALQSVPGVQSATVSLDSHHASVRWEPSTIPDTAAITKAVGEAGYVAKVAEQDTSDRSDDKLEGWQANLWIGALGTSSLMVG